MKKTISIIGGGTAALIFASFIETKVFNVTIYEKNKALGRKFLVAGDGGFNLTHSEPIKDFINRYTPPYFLKDALTQFDNKNFIKWLNAIGINTFVGSSKKIYPEKGIKPIEVLNTIIRHLKTKGVQFEFNKTFTNWKSESEIEFNNSIVVKSNYNVFALGGASWKITGSDGSWLNLFKKQGIKTVPFKASNCAFKINWDAIFISKNEGKPLKNIEISCNGQLQKGEVVITKFGIEGNAIYALSSKINKSLITNKKVGITINLKSSLAYYLILKKLNNSSKSTTNTLQKDIKLSSTAIQLLKMVLTKGEYLEHTTLAKKIQQLPLIITAAAPIDEAISTIGGVALDSVTPNFELKNRHNNYCIGEMLDWNAPTGGYLIQGCASSGHHLANYLNNNN